MLVLMFAIAREVQRFSIGTRRLMLSASGFTKIHGSPGDGDPGWPAGSSNTFEMLVMTLVLAGLPAAGIGGIVSCAVSRLRPVADSLPMAVSYVIVLQIAFPLISVVVAERTWTHTRLRRLGWGAIAYACINLGAGALAARAGGDALLWLVASFVLSAVGAATSVGTTFFDWEAGKGLVRTTYVTAGTKIGGKEIADVQRQFGVRVEALRRSGQDRAYLEPPDARVCVQAGDVLTIRIPARRAQGVRNEMSES
jgi:hypothetical protein